MKYLKADDCLKALKDGEVLQERNRGYCVYLLNGKQVLTNPKRSRPYKFDQKNNWFVSTRYYLDADGNLIDKNNIFYKFEVFLLDRLKGIKNIFDIIVR